MQRETSRENAPELLTAREAASFLRVHRCTVYNLDLPYVLVGARRRWRIEDLREWVLSNRVPKEGVA